MAAMSEVIVNIATGYVAIGLMFAILFVTIGIHRVDEQARGSSIGFRLIVVPGVATLWPLLLMRWVRGDAS